MKHKIKRKPETKIATALEYMKAHKGATPYAAAMFAGIHPTAVYKRLKLDAAKKDGICPCCERPPIERDRLAEALQELVEACPCQNGCATNDMSCATMKAKAVLRAYSKKK